MPPVSHRLHRRLRSAVARTDGAFLEALRRLAPGIREGTANGFHRATHHALAVAQHPVPRPGDGIQRALELWHDVTGEQLEAAHGLLARRPFMGTEQDATEATLGILDQPADAAGYGIRRSD